MKASHVLEAMVGSLLADVVRRLWPKVAKGLVIIAGVAVVLFLQWWQRQSTFVHIAVLSGIATLAALWLHHRLTGRTVPRRPTRRVPQPGAEPTQVLYRWWEPDDLEPGQVCFCGKERVPGELVYVGITGAHRSRELDDDRRQACWWLTQPSVVGTQELYRTRAEVERAEIEAIRTEHPRENKQHAVGWL